MNPVFTLISDISRNSGGKNKNASSELLDASYLVAGIEELSNLINYKEEFR